MLKNLMKNILNNKRHPEFISGSLEHGPFAPHHFSNTREKSLVLKNFRPLKKTDIKSVFSRQSLNGRGKIPNDLFDRASRGADKNVVSFHQLSNFKPLNLKHFNLSTCSLGFTLAEVLITLGIIGIVAAMTIPTLMQNTQNKEFITQMKKDYSVLNSAMEQLKEENGGDISDALSQCNASDNKCIKDVFKTKLHYIKDCDSNDGDNLNACFVDQANAKAMNGQSAPYYYLNYNTTSGLLLNDGSAIAFWMDDQNCKDIRSQGYQNRCGWITIDTNGPAKKPNTWGKDLYVFFIYDNAIRSSIPKITCESADDCGVGTNLGYTCSSKYLYEK